MSGPNSGIISLEERERRVHHRVPYASSAQLRVHDKVYAVQCVNLSLGGAAVKAPVPFAPGDELRLSLKTGDAGERFSVRAQIVRVDGNMLGIRFVEFEQRALVSLLGEVARSEPPPPARSA